MHTTVTLNIPETAAIRARTIANHTGRHFEDVLLQWIDRSAYETPISELPDDEVLALCSIQLDEAQQHELSTFLEQNQEGALDDSERNRLDQLMTIYRQGLKQKAEALHVAVQRGLIPPLS